VQARPVDTVLGCDQIEAAFDAVRGPDMAVRPSGRSDRRFLPYHKRA
jgi:hypothetical protein